MNLWTAAVKFWKSSGLRIPGFGPKIRPSEGLRSPTALVKAWFTLPVRPRHSSSPGPALVTGSGKNTVPTGRTGFLLSQPQGAFVSR